MIEFLEVASALDIHPFDILSGLDLVRSNIRNNNITANDLLSEWGISLEELTLLVRDNPSLRGMLLGYVAELKFKELWLKDERITAFFKHDDHNRLGKGDSIITYKGEQFVIEVKSLQTNSIRKVDDRFWGKTQVDASDRREVKFPDGSTINTTLLLTGEFDILAVNIFAFTNKWHFVFAKNEELPHSTYNKYTETQRQHLLKSLVDVSWPPEPPFFDEPYQILEELYQQRLLKTP